MTENATFKNKSLDKNFKNGHRCKKDYTSSNSTNLKNNIKEDNYIVLREARTNSRSELKKAVILDLPT